MMLAWWRTKTQKDADKFDADLHHLIYKAQQYAQEARWSAPREAHRWRQTAAMLHRVRGDVRSLMHPQDVRDTR